MKWLNEALRILRIFVQHERNSNVPAAIAVGPQLFLIILIPVMVSAVGWEGALFPLGILSFVILSKPKVRIVIINRLIIVWTCAICLWYIYMHENERCTEVGS